MTHPHQEEIAHFLGTRVVYRADFDNALLVGQTNPKCRASDRRDQLYRNAHRSLRLCANLLIARSRRVLSRTEWLCAFACATFMGHLLFLPYGIGVQAPGSGNSVQGAKPLVNV